MARDDQVLFDVDDAQRSITVVMRGQVTDKRLYEMLICLRSMPEYEKAYSVVVDARDIFIGEVTGDGEYELAKLAHTDVNRMAIVFLMWLASVWLRFTRFALTGNRIASRCSRICRKRSNG